MTSSDVFALRTRLGLNQAQFASLLGVTPGTIFRWERHVPHIEPMQERIIEVRGGLFALYVLLQFVFGAIFPECLSGSVRYGAKVTVLLDYFIITLCALAAAFGVSHIFGTDQTQALVAGGIVAIIVVMSDALGKLRGP